MQRFSARWSPVNKVYILQYSPIVNDCCYSIKNLLQKGLQGIFLKLLAPYRRNNPGEKVVV